MLASKSVSSFIMFFGCGLQYAGKNTSLLQNKKVELLSHCPDFLFSAFVCFLLILFFMFCKDIVGTGRTMKVLLNNIEKYKPKMIKVAR